MPTMECLVTTTRVPEATLGKAVEDIRGRPRHPAKALAANHSDQAMLLHPAAAEAHSRNGSEPARPRPVSTPPRRAGLPISRRRPLSPVDGRDNISWPLP